MKVLVSRFSAGTRYLHNRPTRCFASSVTSDYIKANLLEIRSAGSSYGHHSKNFKEVKPKNIIVEYSSPNIAKRFHAGHFRSTIVGQAISNIIEKAGNNVTRLNYLGDWGMQFAILAVGFGKYGSRELLAKTPLTHLYEVYVKASADMEKDDAMKQQARDIFYDMEQNNESSLAFWWTCRSASLIEFEKLYESMGIVFDDYESESMYRDLAQSLLCDLRSKGLLKKCEDNTEGVDLATSDWLKPAPKQKGDRYACLARSNGTSLYLTRDVAAALSRRKRYNFDKIYYLSDKSQELHFRQLFSTLQVIGEDWAHPDAGAVHHLTFGRVQGMKTRKGEVVFFEDIRNEAQELARKERLQHVTRKSGITDEDLLLTTLGMSCLVCNDLKSRLSKDYQFSWNIALQSKGNTGIFLQYTHSRLHSLKEQCGVELSSDVDCSDLCNQEDAVSLLLHMVKYNDVAWKTYQELEPCHTIQYMFELSHLIAKCLRCLTVKGQDWSIAQPRLLLFHCAQTILWNCMTTVGMRPLTKM